MPKLMEKIDRLTSKFAGLETCELCAVEELAELITAIQHKCRNRPANLAEEIAHVTLMVEAVRKKYAVETSEILFYEYDLVRRHLNDEKRDASHTPSKVSHNVKYRRGDKVFTFTTDDYLDAMGTIKRLREQPDVVILAYYPGDEEGNTPFDFLTCV